MSQIALAVCVPMVCLTMRVGAEEGRPR
jgi:hypothetical protein